MKILHLLLTEDCNFRCTYCFKGIDKNSKTMGFETARIAIDKQLKHLNKQEKLNIIFFGGEPFMKFELMKKIYRYVESKGELIKSRVRYSVMTNGSIMDDEILEYILESKTSVMFSLDGEQVSHDKNRINRNGRGTYENIMRNLEMFKQADKNNDLVLRYTITQNNAENMSRDIEHMASLGIEKLTFGLNTFDNWQSCDYETLNHEIEKVCKFYSRNFRNIDIISINEAMKRTLNPREMYLCTTDEKLTVVVPDGKEYICPHLMDETLLVGDVNDESVCNLSNLQIEIDKYNCKDCELRTKCSKCVATIYKPARSVFKKTPNYCEYKKILHKHSQTIIDELYDSYQLDFLAKFTRHDGFCIEDDYSNQNHN